MKLVAQAVDRLKGEHTMAGIDTLVSRLDLTLSVCTSLSYSNLDL